MGTFEGDADVHYCDAQRYQANTNWKKYALAMLILGVTDGWYTKILLVVKMIIS